jgi:hypothetical protein
MFVIGLGFRLAGGAGGSEKPHGFSTNPALMMRVVVQVADVVLFALVGQVAFADQVH